MNLDITAAEAAFLEGRCIGWARFNGSGYSRFSTEVSSMQRKGVIELARIMAGPFPSDGYCDVWRIAHDGADKVR